MSEFRQELMSAERWIPIRYRDFHDIPRAFVIEDSGELLLFDCPFDDEAGDYSVSYVVIRLDPSANAVVDQPSWTDLSKLGSVIGHVPAADVRFDPTKRVAVSAEVLGSY